MPHRSAISNWVCALLTILVTTASLMAQTGHARVRLTDLTGRVVAGSAATVRRDGKPIFTGWTNQLGEILLTDLPVDDLHLTVSCSGFESVLITVAIRNGEEALADVLLPPAALGGPSIEIQVHSPPVEVHFGTLPPLEPLPPLSHPIILIGEINPPAPSAAKRKETVKKPLTTK